MTVFSTAAELLAPNAVSLPLPLGVALSERRQVFAELQRLQDGDERELFGVKLLDEIVHASNSFVAAAERHGWPAPGRSSGDVTPWTPEMLHW